MSDTPQTEFQFVNSTLTSPSVPQDLAIRAMIRKQAMKKASAARKRDGNYGKHNLRQYPVFLFEHDKPDQKMQGEARKPRAGHQFVASLVVSGDQGSTYIKEEEVQEVRQTSLLVNGAGRQRAVTRYAAPLSIPPSLSAKGYELTSMKSGFDILDLSTLATLHIGRAARAALSQNPHHLIHQLRANKQWSYLSFLPSLYGHIPCLSDAADCVIARARQLISPHENWETAVISFYMKALNSLQRALDSPKQRFRPEVLCATEILALYELLDPSGESAWIRHAAGAARLIQLRGPKNYNTEFEKALFMAHTGPIMTECLLNNERCFLEQKSWKAVFRSIVEDSDSITDRSGITIELLCLKCNIPGFAHDVTNIVCNAERDPIYVNSVAARLRLQRVDLLQWLEKYKFILSQIPRMCPGTAEYDSHCKVFATYLSCIIISTRLLAAISLLERDELECETQALASQMQEFELEVNAASSQLCLFMAQTLGVARATKATAMDWKEARTSSPASLTTTFSHSPSTVSSATAYSDWQDDECVETDNSGFIEGWKFERWCTLMGRRIS